MLEVEIDGVFTGCIMPRSLVFIGGSGKALLLSAIKAEAKADVKLMGVQIYKNRRRYKKRALATNMRVGFLPIWLMYGLFTGKWRAGGEREAPLHYLGLPKRAKTQREHHLRGLFPFFFKNAFLWVVELEDDLLTRADIAKIGGLFEARLNSGEVIICYTTKSGSSFFEKEVKIFVE